MVQHEQIRKFVAGTVADDAPVIPISAVLKYNIDVVCEYINCKIPIPGDIEREEPCLAAGLSALLNTCRPSTTSTSCASTSTARYPSQVIQNEKSRALQQTCLP